MISNFTGVHGGSARRQFIFFSHQASENSEKVSQVSQPNNPWPTSDDRY